LAQHKFDQVTGELRENILNFYGDSTGAAPMKNVVAWQKTQEELQNLRAFTPVEAPATQVSKIPAQL
jgi:hypothetical protein